MKFITLVCAALLFSPCVFSKELELFKRCINSQSMLKELDIDVLTWNTIKPSERAFPLLDIWGNSIPIVANDSPKVTIFLYPSLKKIALLNRDNEKLQTIETNTIHSKSIQENLLTPSLGGKSVFSALIESFSVKLSELNCEVFKQEGKQSELFLSNTNTLSLLLLKANYKPYKSTGVIKVPTGFIITTELGFVFYSLKSNTSTVTEVFTNNLNDVYGFINMLNLPSDNSFSNEILSRIVEIWDSTSYVTWSELHEQLKNINAPQETLDSVQEVMDGLVSP